LIWFVTQHGLFGWLWSRAVTVDATTAVPPDRSSRGGLVRALPRSEGGSYLRVDGSRLVEPAPLEIGRAPPPGRIAIHGRGVVIALLGRSDVVLVAGAVGSGEVRIVISSGFFRTTCKHGYDNLIPIEI
jgi:hypothetical protein